jgi:hypothetical protein
MLNINDIIEISISNYNISHYKVIIIFENNIIIASNVKTDDLGRWHMELVIYTSLEILIQQGLKLLVLLVQEASLLNKVLSIN